MTQKIRILHCIETIASGGVEQTILTLIRGLDKNKYHHQIICTWKGGPVAKALEREGVEITAVGSFKHPFEWRKLGKVVSISRNFRPHVIHGAVFEGMTMATVAGLFNKKSVVILEETSDPQNRSKKANLLLKTFSYRADAFQAISEEVGEYLSLKTRIHKGKINVIPNGVEIPEILREGERQKLKEKLGISIDDFVVGFVGRLQNDHKRFSDLLEAISKIKNKSIKLLIVGDGKDRSLLESEIERLKLFERVIQVGFQGNPHPFYDLMDVLCIPSSREGFGLVAVEGMLHRVPIIASSVGGLKGIVKNNTTGYHINPGNQKEIEKYIKQLASQPELCKSFGEMGYQRALKYYSARRYVSNIESLYLDLLTSKGFIFFEKPNN